MAKYKLSRKAEADLRTIAAFTVDTFGIIKTRAYRDDLALKLALPSPTYFQIFDVSYTDHMLFLTV
jgi:plasmid stabilization system protein ParE